MINFIEEWICDGCGGIFDKVDCESELKKDLEEENDN